MKTLHPLEVHTAADAMLRDVICRHCHGRPRNVDRIRKVFNKKAIAWVKEQKTRKEGK